MKESARLRLGELELGNFNVMMPNDDLFVVSSENDDTRSQVNTPENSERPF